MPQQKTFNYTGAAQTFTVPTGVTALTVECWGAQGANWEFNTPGNPVLGGRGGYAKATIPVTPGEVLNLYVGGHPPNVDSDRNVLDKPGGYNGGGPGQVPGGGGTDVRRGGTALSNRVVVAGGGGGAHPYTATTDAGLHAGGQGGNTDGTLGVLQSNASEDKRGGPGTQTAGGVTPGDLSDITVQSGLGQGAGTTSTNTNASAGGGGYYGGGAGRLVSTSGGGTTLCAGGGGSGYVSGTATTMSTGVQSGHGLIVLTYNTAPTMGAVTAPNGGEIYNTSHTVSWTDGSDPDGDALTYDVDLTTDGGSTWTNLKTSFSGTSFTHDFTNVAASTACRVRVRAKDAQGAVSAYDESDANFTIQHNAAPTAPLLGDPANGITADLGAGYTFTYTATDPDSGDAPSAWAFRRKVAGAAAYEYWNAGTGAWQSTVRWNTNPTGSVAFASGVWTNGNTYQWSVATKDTEGLEGPFAADFSVDASSVATTTVTAPSGSVTSTSRPLIRWTLTQPEGEPQQTYQVRLFSQAQYSVTGFDPATSTATWETAEVTSSGAREIQPTVDLLNQTTYRAYVRLKAAGLYTAWASSQFSMALTAPRPPILALTDEPKSPFGPRVRIDLRMDPSLNLLTGNQASLETDTTGWVGSSTTVARSTAQAFDGTASLSLTRTGTVGSAHAYLSSRPAAVAGQVYTAVAYSRAATTARRTFLVLLWYDAAGTNLGQSQGPDFANNAAGWTQVRHTAQAPANTASIRVDIHHADSAVNEVHYVDAVGLFATPTGNLVTNPDFENGTAGWSASPGSVAQSQAQAYTGRSSMLVTWPTAGANGVAARAPHPLTAGQTYTASAWVYVPSGSPDVAIYRAASGDSGGSGPTVTTKGAWTRATLTFTAAVSASYDVGVIVKTAATAGQQVYVDAVQVVVGSEPVDYLPPTTHNLSPGPSFEDGGTGGWRNVSLGNSFGNTTTQAYIGTRSLRLAANGSPQSAALAVQVEAVTYTASLYARADDAADVELTFGGGSSGRVVLGTGWQRLVVTGKPSAAGISDLQAVLRTANVSVYFDAVQVEQGSVATPYVDGSLGLAEGARWDASENLLSAAASSFEDGTTGGYGAANSTLAVSTAWAADGTQSLEITPSSTTVADSFAGRNVPMLPNTTYTVSGTIRVPAAQTGTLDNRGRRIVCYAFKADNTLIGNVGQSAQAANAVGTTRLSVTFTAPAETSYVSMRLYNGALSGGGTVLWDAVQVEQRPYATAYAAPGTAHASTSTRQHRFESGGFTQTMTYLVERSEDGGSVWTAVRNAEALDVDVQQRGVAYDYEPPRGQPVLYRASTVADV